MAGARSPFDRRRRGALVTFKDPARQKTASNTLRTCSSQVGTPRRKNEGIVEGSCDTKTWPAGRCGGFGRGRSSRARRGRRGRAGPVWFGRWRGRITGVAFPRRGEVAPLRGACPRESGGDLDLPSADEPGQHGLRRDIGIGGQEGLGLAGNIQSLFKVYRAVERFWRKMLCSRSWAGAPSDLGCLPSDQGQGHRYCNPNCSCLTGRCRASWCSEPTAEERGAGNPHALSHPLIFPTTRFAGSFEGMTASFDGELMVAG